MSLERTEYHLPYSVGKKKCFNHFFVGLQENGNRSRTLKSILNRDIRLGHTFVQCLKYHHISKKKRFRWPLIFSKVGDNIKVISLLNMGIGGPTHVATIYIRLSSCLIINANLLRLTCTKVLKHEIIVHNSWFWDYKLDTRLTVKFTGSEICPPGSMYNFPSINMSPVLIFCWETFTSLILVDLFLQVLYHLSYVQCVVAFAKCQGLQNPDNPKMNSSQTSSCK